MDKFETTVEERDWYKEQYERLLAARTAKFPKYGAVTKEKQNAAGLNPFAIELLAESFASRRERWGDETVCCIGFGKDREPVFICISSLEPKEDEG